MDFVKPTQYHSRVVALYNIVRSACGKMKGSQFLELLFETFFYMVNILIRCNVKCMLLTNQNNSLP